MGFLQDIGSAITNINPARALAAIGTLGASELSGVGTAMGAADNAAKQNQSELPQVPGMDPRIKQMADQQYQTSQDFQNNAGNLKQQQGNMAQQASNQGLADQQSKINSSANSRGLLYSGLRQGAQAGARGQAANNLADKQSQINQNVDQQAAGLREKALQSQMGVQGLQNQRNAIAQNMMNAASGSKGLLGNIFG